MSVLCFEYLFNKLQLKTKSSNTKTGTYKGFDWR